MEDVLAVYTRPRDGDCPLVCLDETSKQLIAETRVPISMKAGRPARFDYEYERNGTANLFMMFAPLEGWRNVKVTDRHTAVDYARVLKDLADIHFAHAKTIVLVQDNLSIHSKACMGHFLSRSGCAAFRLSWSSHSLVRPALQDSSVPTARLSRRRAQRRSRMAAPFNGHPKGLSLTDASTAARYRRSARKHR